MAKGKIEIEVEKLNYSLGEEIKGKINMILKKPIKARQLRVSLIGERRSSNYTYSRTKGSNYSKSKNNVFSFPMPLDSEKIYPLNSTYDFNIKIPRDVLTNPSSEGAFGTLLKTAQMVSGIGQIHWYLYAELDIPWKIDITKKLQINIG